MSRTITIQPEAFTDNVWVGKTGEIVEGKKLPYPFHIAEDGKVLRQEFWNGDPSGIVGFQRDVEVQKVDLWWADAAKNPEQAVGMFPVFTQTGGTLYTYTVAIESVSVHEETAR